MPRLQRNLEPRHLTPAGFQEFYDMWREMRDQVNSLGGFNGPISLVNDINLNGKRITNVGEAQETTDVLTQDTADPLYGIEVQQAAMEAVGTNMLQSARRLNDTTQQHGVSTDLNTQGSIPPSNITGSLTYTTVAGTSITWTWANIVIQYADLTFRAIKNGSLTVTGLANTLYSFYPYFDTTNGILIFVPINGVGTGVPAVAFASPSTLAAQFQTADGRIALTSGATTATINGGAGGATLRTR